MDIDIGCDVSNLLVPSTSKLIEETIVLGK